MSSSKRMDTSKTSKENNKKGIIFNDINTWAIKQQKDKKETWVHIFSSREANWKTLHIYDIS